MYVLSCLITGPNKFTEYAARAKLSPFIYKKRAQFCSRMLYFTEFFSRPRNLCFADSTMNNCILTLTIELPM